MTLILTLNHYASPRPRGSRLEDQDQGIKVEVRGSRSGEGSRLGQGRGGVKVWGFEVVVKVGGQDRGRGHGWGSSSGEGSRLGGQGCGPGRGSRSWGQGQGYDRWPQSRGQCRGSKSGGGVNVRGSMSGGGVMVRGMMVKVWGVWVRWSVGFIVGGGCR